MPTVLGLGIDALHTQEVHISKMALYLKLNMSMYYRRNLGRQKPTTSLVGFAEWKCELDSLGSLEQFYVFAADFQHLVRA